MPSGPLALDDHNGIRDMEAEVIEAALFAFGSDQPAKQVNAAWD